MRERELEAVVRCATLSRVFGMSRDIEQLRRAQERFIGIAPAVGSVWGRSGTEYVVKGFAMREAEEEVEVLYGSPDSGSDWATWGGVCSDRSPVADEFRRRCASVMGYGAEQFGCASGQMELTPVGSVWRHYKGGLYEIRGHAIRESTGELELLYRSLDPACALPLNWSRLYSSWTSALVHDGARTQRFAVVPRK